MIFFRKVIDMIDDDIIAETLIEKFKSKQGRCDQWHAITSFPLDPLDSFGMKLSFRTYKGHSRLVTVCIVDVPPKCNFDRYSALVAEHDALRATKRSIEDAHKAASLNFGDHIRFARAFYSRRRMTKH